MSSWRCVFLLSHIAKADMGDRTLSQVIDGIISHASLRLMLHALVYNLLNDISFASQSTEATTCCWFITVSWKLSDWWHSQFRHKSSFMCVGHTISRNSATPLSQPPNKLNRACVITQLKTKTYHRWSERDWQQIERYQAFCNDQVLSQIIVWCKHASNLRSISNTSRCQNATPWKNGN